MSGDGNKTATRYSTRGKRDKDTTITKTTEESKKEEQAAASDTGVSTTAKNKDKETRAASNKKDPKDTKKDSPAASAAASTEDKDAGTAATGEATASKKQAPVAVKVEDESPPATAEVSDGKATTEDHGQKTDKTETEKKDTPSDGDAPKDAPAAADKDKMPADVADAADKTEEEANDMKQEDGNAGTDATTPSKEIIRTVYWPAAERRYDEITIENDFEFDDETQTITGICEKAPRHFPNTHFMRRLAGHLRLGLGRNATKEAILEKICQTHYGAAFTRPAVEDESSSSRKRRSSDANAASTVLKKRPVIMKPGASAKKTSAGGANAASTVEATLKARAAALTALSSSLDTIATTIRQAEERLQKLCEAAKVNFYAALMDRSKLTNDYLRTHFAEYDQFLSTQKDMIASITELSKGNDIPATPGAPGITAASAKKATGPVGGVAAMTVGISIPSGSGPDPEDVTNHMEV